MDQFGDGDSNDKGRPSTQEAATQDEADSDTGDSVDASSSESEMEVDDEPAEECSDNGEDDSDMETEEQKDDPPIVMESGEQEVGLIIILNSQLFIYMYIP